MKTKFLKILGATALVMSAGAEAYVIDLFTEPDRQAVKDSDDGGDYNTRAFQSSEAGPYPDTILGGYRDIMVNTISGGENSGDATNCEFDDCSTLRVQDGMLTFNNDTGVVGEAEVQWDGQGNGTTFDETGLQTDGVGLDFVNQEGCPAGGCDRFQFEVFETDQGFIFTVGVYTDADNFTEFDLIATANEGQRDLLFSDFQIAELCGLTSGLEGIGVKAVRCGGSGTPGQAAGWNVVDFTNVGAMRIAFNGEGGSGDNTDANGRTIALDLEIGAITKTGVPEPGVLALLGVGLAAGALARRRRVH